MIVASSSCRIALIEAVFCFDFFFFKNVTVFFCAFFINLLFIHWYCTWLSIYLLCLLILFFILLLYYIFFCVFEWFCGWRQLCVWFLNFFFLSFSKCLKKNLIQYSSFYANSNQIHIFNQSCFVFLFIYFFILLLTGFFWIFWIFLIFWFFLIFWIFFLLFLFFYLLLYVYSLFMLFCCWSHCFKFVDNNLVLDRWVLHSIRQRVPHRTAT